MSQSTHSWMLEFAYNKTMEWLKTSRETQTLNCTGLGESSAANKDTAMRPIQKDIRTKKSFSKARKRELLQDKTEDLKLEVVII